MKSYNDIEKQVNRIIAAYLIDECSQPHNQRHAAIIRKLRDIQHRYTFNINHAEGFCISMEWAEAQRVDHGAIYHVYESASKRYPREIYMNH